MYAIRPVNATLVASWVSMVVWRCANCDAMVYAATGATAKPVNGKRPFRTNLARWNAVVE